MESKDILRDADRAAAAPFLTYPKVPAWLIGVYGLTGAALAWSVFQSFAGHYGISVSVSLVSAAVLISYTAWYQRKAGVTPNQQNAPAEIKKASVGFVVWFLLGCVLAIAVGALTRDVTITMIASAILLASPPAWYWYVGYPKACAAVRERLA